MENKKEWIVKYQYIPEYLRGMNITVKEAEEEIINRLVLKMREKAGICPLFLVKEPVKTKSIMLTLTNSERRTSWAKDKGLDVSIIDKSAHA